MVFQILNRILSTGESLSRFLNSRGVTTRGEPKLTDPFAPCFRSRRTSRSVARLFAAAAVPLCTTGMQLFYRPPQLLLCLYPRASSGRDDANNVRPAQQL